MRTSPEPPLQLDNHTFSTAFPQSSNHDFIAFSKDSIAYALRKSVLHFCPEVFKGVDESLSITGTPQELPQVRLPQDSQVLDIIFGSLLPEPDIEFELEKVSIVISCYVYSTGLLRTLALANLRSRVDGEVFFVDVLRIYGLASHYDLSSVREKAYHRLENDQCFFRMGTFISLIRRGMVPTGEGINQETMTRLLLDFDAICFYNLNTTIESYAEKYRPTDCFKYEIWWKDLLLEVKKENRPSMNLEGVLLKAQQRGVDCERPNQCRCSKRINVTVSSVQSKKKHKPSIDFV